jgi:hypothetical protein
VPAIPASFLSVDRAFLDRLGGFSRSYARAALEDVDLCLRAVARDAPAWVHPLPMWMLERQGPPRPEPSKGGSLLNDWLLNRQFGELIGSGRLSAAMPVPVA